MEPKFIYVFDIESRDKLIAAGYTLLKSDKRNNVFIFNNNISLSFSYSDINHAFSNVLSF